MSVGWNPWHGCRKISPGCAHCYVYRQDEMYGSAVSSREVRRTSNFDLPIKRKRDRSYKIAEGEMVFTCFTSDFWVDESDAWRAEAWSFIRQRNDLMFMVFTKRIDRFCVALPDDWGDGYDNVIIGCTVENQQMADFRLPIFRELPIKHRIIICAPLLEPINLERYLDQQIEELAVSGESGTEARPCHYDWVLDLRQQCVAREVAFCFHQTGARFVKDGRMYYVRRPFQLSQARKAGIDYKTNRMII